MINPIKKLDDKAVEIYNTKMVEAFKALEKEASSDKNWQVSFFHDYLLLQDPQAREDMTKWELANECIREFEALYQGEKYQWIKGDLKAINDLKRYEWLINQHQKALNAAKECHVLGVDLKC